MSQPKTTSQKPNPPSTAEKNLSRWMYLPRRMPSMSQTPTFTFSTGEPRTESRISSWRPAVDLVFFASSFIYCSRVKPEQGGLGEIPEVARRYPFVRSEWNGLGSMLRHLRDSAPTPFT